MLTTSEEDGQFNKPDNDIQSNKSWKRALSLTNSSVDGVMLLELTSSRAAIPMSSIKELAKTSAAAAQLRVDVRWLRLLVVTITATATMTIVLVLCSGAGIRLGTVSGNQDEKSLKSRLDNYNSVSGGIVAALLAPMELALSMLAAVACLSFMPKLTLQVGMHSHVVTAGLAAVVTFLVTNGLSALNVQLIPGDVNAVITSADLTRSKPIVDIQPAPALNGSLLTTWNKSFNETEPRNSVLNTIFRTHLMDRNSSTGEDKAPFPRFGFGTRSWHLDTLSTALVPNGSIQFSLDSTELPSDKELPMSVDNASYLVLAASLALPWLMKLPGTYDVETDGGGVAEMDSLPYLWNRTFVPELFRSKIAEKSSNTSGQVFAATELAGISPSDFIATSTSLLHETMTAASNISVGDVNVTYQKTELSDSVSLQAVTLDISTMVLQDGDLLDCDDLCSSDGCALPSSYGLEDFLGAGFESIQPFVYASGICEDNAGKFLVSYADNGGFSWSPSSDFNKCKRRSNSSMLLVGVGKKIVGDTLNIHTTNDTGTTHTMVQTDGLHVEYSVTFGILSWVVEDLDSTYHAACHAPLGCRGVHYGLNATADSDVLVVDVSSLPLNDLDIFSLDFYLDQGYAAVSWKQLVQHIWPNGDAADLLLPRRFKTITAAAWETVQTKTTSGYFDNLIPTVEKNHLYAEESLQMTYTAGIFYLFRDAVLHHRLNRSSTALEFVGNTQQLHVQASIPQLNVIISLVGVALVVSGALVVAVLRKRTSNEIAHAVDVEVVAEAMFNKAKFPPVFLATALRDALTNAEQDMPLDNLRLQHIELVSTEELRSHVDSTLTVYSSPSTTQAA